MRSTPSLTNSVSISVHFCCCIALLLQLRSPNPIVPSVYSFQPIPSSLPSLSSPSSPSPSLSHHHRHRTTMSAVAGRRIVGKLTPETSAFLMCDMQERFQPIIHNFETVANTSRYLTSVAKTLGIPIVITEQYSKVFGKTVPQCFAEPEDLKTIPTFEKKKFSMCTEEFNAHIKTLDRDNFVLFGIESHVCVQQTALDLLEEGKHVHVIADGVSSQSPYDREIALQRMVQAGAFLTTSQSVAFMLMQTAGHENFKPISKLTVEHMKLTNSFEEQMASNKRPREE